MKLTYSLLLRDLYVAFASAAKHKGKMSYVVRFRASLKMNLACMALVLILRLYKPLPSKCFIVTEPKQREVFAAQFPDRVVHHLYFNMTHLLYEATFIRDSYSCIEGRGTLDGILRLSDHIRRCSQNYTRECYILKLDIRGYFMHINRRRLLQICLSTLDRMQHHRITKEAAESFGVSPSKRWKDVLDMDFMRWLTEVIVMLDPKTSCERAMPISAWDGLDPAKSLFCTADGCGLPIGNLTSQLFSNVYLNILDQFCKRVLHCRHYGRYVDDFFIVSCDRRWLLSLVPRIREFLKEELGLDLHMGKVRISRASQGVEFLGAYIKPYRIYLSNDTLERIRQHLKELDFSDPDKVQKTVNSYLGIMSHTASYHLRRELFFRPEFLTIAPFDRWMTKMEKPTGNHPLRSRRHRSVCCRITAAKSR